MKPRPPRGPNGTNVRLGGRWPLFWGLQLRETAGAQGLPHLSTSTPHFPHLAPPHRACAIDFGARTRPICVPQLGQMTCSVLIPHLFLRNVPTITKTHPTDRIMKIADARIVMITFRSFSNACEQINKSIDSCQRTSTRYRPSFDYTTRRSCNSPCEGSNKPSRHRADALKESSAGSSGDISP